MWGEKARLCKIWEKKRFFGFQGKTVANTGFWNAHWKNVKNTTE